MSTADPTTTTLEPTDFDGAWKEALEFYLRPIMELCFPAVAAEIDWSIAPEFMDKELQEVVRDADLGKQRVDKLVKVRTLRGEEMWVFLHIEVQSQRDLGHPRRNYQYKHRLTDRYGFPVVTLVILADECEDWTPDHYEESLWGCQILFRYPVCKLLRLEKEVDLESSENPAAIVIAAHLAAQRMRRDAQGRFDMKRQLTRRLFARGYEKKDILEIFRLIDWLLHLPREMEVALRQEMAEYDGTPTMAYITSIERIATEKGLEKGQILATQKSILETLELRFPRIPEGLREEIESIQDLEHLGHLHRHAVVCADIEAFAERL